ncbi:MAG: phosphate ABC transporter substrate-binding protein, partial [Coleofasciculus sp.]
MSQKNETGTLIAALVITLVILAGGFWWFTRESGMNLEALMGGENNSTQNPSPPTQPANPGTPAANPNSAFAPPQTVPSGTIVRIAGSTSIVQINQALKQSFEQQFPGT